MKISTPLKKTSISSYFTPHSHYALNKVSTLKVKPTIPSFPVITSTPSIESYEEIPSLKTKSFLEKKLNLETIFSHSRRKFLTFKKVLLSERFTAPYLPEEHASTISSPRLHPFRLFLHLKLRMIT